MTCDQFRELISARIDGEIPPADITLIDAHILVCGSCSQYEHDAYALRRSLRVSASPAPTASPRSVRAALQPTTTASIMRLALFVLGATLVVLHLRAILFVDSGLDAHVGRHDGVFGAALGIGMLAVALKPERAIGLVLLTSAIAILMSVVAVVDLVAGRTSVLSEAIHLVELAGLVCLWVISGGPTRLQRRSGALIGRLRASTVPPWPPL